MKIAVASGKGGTGKTTIAVNLAVVALIRGKKAAYVDCDVEEPNGHIFLKPEIDAVSFVTIPVPRIDEQKCNGCGECGRICSFNAIAVILDKALVYSELCHGCGGCFLACLEDAIIEVPREMGRVESGKALVKDAGGEKKLDFVHGILDVGEAMPVPVIRDVRNAVPDVDWVIIDAPPGTSCSMVETVRDSDFALLVTEPTPFGLHDLELAFRTVGELGVPAGVVINRTGTGDSGVWDFCDKEGLEILAEIPESREVVEIYSRGGLLVAESENFAGIIGDLMDKLERKVLSVKK